MAENLIGKNGLPTYSVALVEISATPLAAAMREPACGELQRRRLESRERHAAPQPEQAQIEREHGAEQRRNPRMWTRLTTP